MPSEASADSFIEFASQLLQAYPSLATISITYANSAKKLGKTAADDSKKASNFTAFKVYEPRSGKCIKYKTYKIKELSKLLTFLGPKGVSVTRPKKRRATDEPENDDEKRQKTVTEHTVGLSSILSNTKFDHLDELAPAGEFNKAATPGAEDKGQDTSLAAGKKKKGKKKGKK